MPTNISGRLTTILAVLVLAMWTLFPGIFRGDTTPNLKRGLDMVGGSSLLYQIKIPEGQVPRPTLAEEVASQLRRRVDPDGVKNLVWRPQGADRLEIQIPLSSETDDAKKARATFADAQRTFNDFNVRLAQIDLALSKPQADRDAELARLAKGSPLRTKLLAEAAVVQDKLTELEKSQSDPLQQGKLEKERDKLLRDIDGVNVALSELDDALNTQPASEVTPRLESLRARDPAFAARIAGMDTYARASTDWARLKGKSDDIDSVKQLLRGSGVLSFHIAVTLNDPDATASAITAMRERIAKDGPRSRSGDSMKWFKLDKREKLATAPIAEIYNGEPYILTWITPNKSMANGQGQPKWSLESSFATQDQNGGNAVGFKFDPIGALQFGQLTGRNISNLLCAVLDGRVVSCATINSQINAQGIISGGTGGFDRDELAYLVNTLGAGSLSAQLEDEPMVERTVGPQLGADNLRRGLMACVFGIVVVAIFLIGYYYLSGVVAMIAVTLNVVLILAGMAAFGATFTLPGVAGIILTIGMAVDANVLIFERLREEQVRGLSLRIALRNAYDRAASAIWDSNITTAITAAILYFIGTEDVKGFGLTLMLGLVASLFTALYVTRTLFFILIEKMGVETLGSVPLTLPWWDRFLRPNIDWMKLSPIFITFSVVFLTIGTALFAWKFKQGKVLDIEFAGGTVVQFDLLQPKSIDEVRAIIDARSDADPESLPSPSVQSVGDAVRTDGKAAFSSYEVITVNADAVAVRKTLGTALQGMLNVKQAATFAGIDGDLTAAMSTGVVVPVESETQRVNGQLLENVGDHTGGVAIILKGLAPALAADDVKQRIEQIRLAGGAAAGNAVGFRKVDVNALADGSGVVVFASDPEIAYSADDVAKREDWTTSLAGPTWQKVVDAVSKPADFARVSTINQQVAGETSIDAIVALFLSILFIVLYIWIRFGDFKYGSATVVALFHDTLFVLAGIGVAHFIAETFVGSMLLLEPFRLNLTMVSAILTVMGFSMNDTVVVFDRIRENRGKVGHVDRQVINDSINQTLSRTVLTGATTMVTLAVMYATGGPGIHGFTFALLVGFVVGTYSSIAIASPLLLLGSRKQALTKNPMIVASAVK